jgi:hypothetical protein
MPGITAVMTRHGLAATQSFGGNIVVRLTVLTGYNHSVSML